MSSTIVSTVQSVLQDKFHLCDRCIGLYIGSYCVENSSTETTTPSKNQRRGTCPLCLGLLSNSNSNEKNDNYAPAILENEIRSKIKEKIRPYHVFSDDNTTTRRTMNYISKDSPTIVIPNCILLMAHVISCTLESIIIENETNLTNDISNSSEGDFSFKIKSAIQIYNEIKEEIRDFVRDLIIKVNKENNDSIIQNKKQEKGKSDHFNIDPWDEEDGTITKSLQKEEAGYLKFHMIITPKLYYPHLPCGGRGSFSGDFSLLLPKLSTKRDRKRFRGNDPLPKQGGDPRMNLYSHVKLELAKNLDEIILYENNIDEKKKKDSNEPDSNNIVKIAKLNQQCCLLEKNAIVKHIETIGSTNEMKEVISNWAMKDFQSWREKHLHRIHDYHNSSSASASGTASMEQNFLDVHLTCWRNHFYLKGKYTKSRRDVSQTPFFVNDDDNDHNDDDEKNEKKQRVTGELSCHHQQNDKRSNKRMKRLGTSSVEEEICPIISNIACHGISECNNEPKIKGSTTNSGNLVYGMCKFHASGREDMDVRMILPPNTLDNQDSIKGEGSGSGRPFVCEVIDAHKLPTKEELQMVVNVINNDSSSVLNTVTISEKGHWVDENERTHVQYGQNPNGVGISGLDYCLSSSFSNLQSETEEKVKFYGCLCWSKAKIPSQIYLENKLVKGGNPDRNDNIYPLTIEQSTPLRVLHRRSADKRIRSVLSLNVQRIDEHWFRLHLSTSAGTYVKEFCHGDCGRTKPSISSLLGCKTDIVELDCEGISIF